MTTGNLTCTTLTVSGAVTTGALTCSGLLTANGGLTVASGQTLTLTGATVAGAPTWSSSQAITLSTAAQPNVTSLGTLTSLVTAGAISGGSLMASGPLNAALLTLQTSGTTYAAIKDNGTNVVLSISDQAAGRGGLVVTGALSSTGNLTVSGTGPHSIGRAIDTNSQVIIGGTFAGAGSSSGLVVTSTLTAIAGSNSSAYYSAPTINKAGSGTHPDFATMLLDAPTIGAGAATLTNATTLKISGAPSVGTNQRALWVAAGLSQFDGALTLTGVGGAGTGVVSVGAADSGGTGYRVLRIPN